MWDSSVAVLFLYMAHSAQVGARSLQPLRPISWRRPTIWAGCPYPRIAVISLILSAADAFNEQLFFGKTLTVRATASRVSF